MGQWIADNIATLLICLAVGIAVAVALARLWKNRHNGCSGGCENCPLGDACRQKKSSK